MLRRLRRLPREDLVREVSTLLAACRAQLADELATLREGEPIPQRFTARPPRSRCYRQAKLPPWRTLGAVLVPVITFFGRNLTW